MKELLEQLPTYASDLKLNFSNVIENPEETQLTKIQIMGTALASAYATRQNKLIVAMEAYAQEILDEALINGAKAAASIMAMNNIYYRATHIMQDKDYMAMPIKLRMTILVKHGIEKKDFELMSLAVSSINGCNMCLDVHANALIKIGLEKSTIQHALRISAVMNGIAQVIEIEYGQE